MKKTIDHITYYVVYGWMFLHALLPLKFLYVLSDLLYFTVYRIIGYRKKVVRKNLRKSFPDRTREELRVIEKEFYHHLCDYLIETLKLLHITEEEMQRRMRFENIELVNDVMKDGKSAMLFLGHYCNWEWVTSLNLNFKDGRLLGQIYRPLKNKAFDDLFLKIRSRFSTIGISKNNTLRAIINLRNKKQQILIGFMADQTPSAHNIHYWTEFLNQDTPVFTGVERIAKQTGFSVLYLDIRKVKRGYYSARFIPITQDPKNEPEFAITEKYIRAMEHTIERRPAYWLWTHKRWKWTREEVVQVQNQQHGK